MLLAGLIGFVVGVAAGFVVCRQGFGQTVRVLSDHLKWAREQEAIATDRLVHAWREDNATIAPRPPEPVPPPEPLPRVLQEEVDGWETPETRAVVEEKIRGMMRRGFNSTRILLELDNHHPAGP